MVVLNINGYGVLAFKAECDAIVPAGIDSITLWVTLKAMEAHAGTIHVLRPGRDIQCHKNATHAIDPQHGQLRRTAFFSELADGLAAERLYHSQIVTSNIGST